uniref:MBD domain-containing protein n=1 Tax=Strigamia maritima TaxID=126957 RepID=T1IWZ7_STRMM
MRIYERNSKYCTLIGKLEDGLYRVTSPIQYKAVGLLPVASSKSNLSTKAPDMNNIQNYSVSVNMWHQRFGHMYTKGLNYLAKDNNVKDGRDTIYVPPADSDDDDDDDSHPSAPPVPAPGAIARQVRIQTIAAPITPTSPPFVSTLPSMPGWEREAIQRQKGITKGRWDIYFYLPGEQYALRSKPEVKEYLENELGQTYRPDLFDWQPAQATTSTVTQETNVDDVLVDESTDQSYASTGETADNTFETYAVRVYCASIKEPE